MARCTRVNEQEHPSALSDSNDEFDRSSSSSDHDESSSLGSRSAGSSEELENVWRAFLLDQSCAKKQTASSSKPCRENEEALTHCMSQHDIVNQFVPMPASLCIIVLLVLL